MQITIFYFLGFVCFSICDEISQLKHVHAVFRHGDRTPVNIFPTDSNTIDKWPEGLGKLTNLGIREHFQLGSWLKRRYRDLLGDQVDISQIYIRSSDIDRTLMSAEANIAGLLYNSTNEIISRLKWRPFPIHTVESTRDMILLSKDNCQLYDEEYQKLINSFSDKFQKFQPLLALMKEKTGIHDLTFLSTWKIYDTLFCERQHSMKPDAWITDSVWEQMVQLNDLSWQIMNYGDLARVSGGFLLKEIIDNITSLTDPNSAITFNQSKLIMYSGHDTDVAPLTSLLGIFDNIQPGYAYCLLIELHHIPSAVDPWAIKVVYKNYTNSTGGTNIPAAIIPGCAAELCPLNRFIELTKSKIISRKEYRDICYPKENILMLSQILFAFVAVCCILLIIIMFIIRAIRRTDQYRYSHVNTEPNIN